MLVSGYSLNSYGSMIVSEPRTQAFAEALAGAVFPGSHVIDLGAGPGLFALLACKLGASHVTAIEPDVSLEIARQASKDNGYNERITFVRDLSIHYQAEEKADIVISDIRGVLPLFEHHIPTIRDVRERLLKPDGILIPARDRIYAALVEAPETYSGYRNPWIENNYGVDLSAAYQQAINAWRRTYQSAEALLTKPQVFTTLDYRTVEETNYHASLEFTAERSGAVHAILMWFDTELASGIGFSNAPGEPEQVYGQAFFPLEQPVSLAEGATAEIDVSASFINGAYVWTWAFRATDVAGKVHQFRQSSFKAAILDHDYLVPRAASYSPPPRRAQTIDIFCLEQFDGCLSLSDIASRLQAKFPDDFLDRASALEHVADLSTRYYRSNRNSCVEKQPNGRREQ
jgi:type I protein arginine methyltransferase